MSRIGDNGHRRGAPPSSHRRSPRGKRPESAPKKSIPAATQPLAQFVQQATQKIKAFSYTLATRATQTTIFNAAKEAIAATEQVMGPEIDYTQLAEQQNVMIAAIRQQKNPDKATQALQARLVEQYQAVIAVGLSNATLEYHIAWGAEDKRKWQHTATSFADKMYEDNPGEMQGLMLMLAAYSNVDLDLAAIRHHIQQSKIIVAAPELEPVPLPNQDPSDYGSNPAAAAAYAHRTGLTRS